MNTPSQKQEIKQILEYCLEHNHVGHELEPEEDGPSCNWITSKGKKKCDCPWGAYEEMLTDKILELLSSKDQQHKQEEDIYKQALVQEAEKVGRLTAQLQEKELDLEEKEREFIEELTAIKKVELSSLDMEERPTVYNLNLLIDKYSHSKKDEVDV